MKEKKPVYNGYTERYLTGAELKKLLKDRYYGRGRHHAVVLGLSIPDYLDLIGIADDQSYRIFINDYFCRIMNSDTDGMIAFFAHSSFEHLNICKQPEDIQIERTCSVCGAPMKFKTGKYGEFLGCSNYPKCKHTVHIPIIGNL